MRSGYLRTAFSGDSPLARAVTKYCFCISSSMLARSRRIIAAVPAEPITSIGIHRWFTPDTTLAADPGAPLYCGSIRPPVDNPQDRKGAVWGNVVDVRVDHGGPTNLRKQTEKKN